MLGEVFEGECSEEKYKLFCEEGAVLFLFRNYCCLRLTHTNIFLTKHLIYAAFPLTRIKRSPIWISTW